LVLVTAAPPSGGFVGAAPVWENMLKDAFIFICQCPVLGTFAQEWGFVVVCESLPHLWGGN
jgi:hypothetical protein